MAEMHPRRLMPARARGRSLMRVRAWHAQPDARSRPRWRRRLLIAGDAALALALAALAVASPAPGDGPRIGAAGIALALLQTLPLAFRRWCPVCVLAMVVAATLGTAIAATRGTAIAGDAHVAGPVCVLVALYSVAVRCRRRTAAWAGIAAGAVLAWPLWLDSNGNTLGVVLILSFLAAGWLSGAYLGELRARAAHSRREQELETGRAVAEEQARVGRELHDVIAHTLSVIIIQAGAAEDVFGTSPQAARQALGSIGAAGRQALAELRRVLAAVRPQPGQEEDGWAPPPGLSGLGELLDRVRAAGLHVTARIDGAPADLPAGLDLAAYRIVQEALTNTLKHARAQAAEVTVRYRPAGLVLEVLDDGQPAAPAGPRGPAPGRGLIGIRERAALHGGTCAAGPQPGGGFGVRVSLPLDAVGRAGTVASGTAAMPPGETVAIKETAMSRTARPDSRSGPRRRRRLLIAGDAALALVLAAGAVAVAAAVPSQAEPGRAAGIAVALLQTLPLAFRRWRPLWVLAVVVAATLAAEIAREGNGLFGLATAVALYSVAAYCPRRQAAWAGIATGAVLAWPLVRDGGGPGGLQALEQVGQDAVISLGFPALAWLSGAYVSELRARAARSRREQELETGRAVAEEQARVGRELHDVIAHTLSVIIIQAGAAEDVFGTSPQAARQALGSIGAAGRQALAELRRVLAAVRPQPGQEEDGWAPPPGLSGLGELLDRVRAAGLHVTARIDGAPADLPAGLDLAAYRIVQEALTNTLKHARAQAAEVTLRYRPAGLVLEVLDDGQPAAPARAGPPRDAGSSASASARRCTAGPVTAGPRPGGGFGVRVRLPLPGDRPS